MRSSTALLLVFAVAPSASAVGLQTGDWVVADPDANAVYRVDPQTGERTLISQDGLFRYPSGVALDAQRRILVADPDANAIFRVDPGTGGQSTVSLGQSFRFPTGVAVEDSGDLLVTDPDADAIFRVDPLTGDQQVATAAVDTLFATGVAVEASGDYVLADPDDAAIRRWDPDLSRGSTLSSEGLFAFPTDVTVDAVEDLLVADPDANGFARVDPMTGDQTPVGPEGAFLYPTGIAFVPEPGPIRQLAALLVALACLARKARPRGHRGGGAWRLRIRRPTSRWAESLYPVVHGTVLESNSCARGCGGFAPAHHNSGGFVRPREKEETCCNASST